MLQFRLSSTDQRALDVAVGKFLQALPAEERASAEVTVLPRLEGSLRRQVEVAGESDKIVKRISLLPLPNDVAVSVRLPE
jgi:ribosomal protein S10